MRVGGYTWTGMQDTKSPIFLSHWVLSHVGEATSKQYIRTHKSSFRHLWETTETNTGHLQHAKPSAEIVTFTTLKLLWQWKAFTAPSVRFEVSTSIPLLIFGLCSFYSGMFMLECLLHAATINRILCYIQCLAQSIGLPFHSAVKGLSWVQWLWWHGSELPCQSKNTSPQPNKYLFEKQSAC